MAPNRFNLKNIDKWLIKVTGATGYPGLRRLLKIQDEMIEENIPVNPVKIASRIGCQVIYDKIAAPRLEISKRTGLKVIRIPIEMPKPIQRFSIAHELGHLLFLDENENYQRSSYIDEREYSRSGHVKNRARVRLETLCDYAAGLILVRPESLEKFFLSKKPIDLEVIISLSQEFDVLPNVIFRRLIQDDIFPQYPIPLLLSYSCNRYKGIDEKWRVSERLYCKGEIGKNIPWWNQGIEKMGINFPSPEKFNKTTLNEYKYDYEKTFQFEQEKWKMKLDVSEKTRYWLLARFELVSDNNSLFCS